jgi:aminopeptidase-like protein
LGCILTAIGATLTIWCIRCFADRLVIRLVTEVTIDQRLRAGSVSAAKRQSAIHELFQHVGCDTYEQQIERHSANVICTLPGETSATIVVGAHFDFVPEGNGIVDDWSGASLLPSLYQTLKQKTRQHTYQFVAFAGEERGLIGSFRYVKRLTSDQKSRTQAFVNLECLGLTPPKVWVRRSTPMLVARLAEIANSANIPLQRVDVDNVGDDDTHPFLYKKIPVISIHSITQETFAILHSNRDNITAIHPDDYYNAYRLVAFYLAYLDLKLPSELGPSTAPSHPR